MNVFSSSDQISHWVVVPDKLQFNSFLHIVDQIFQLSVAQLI